MKATQAWLDHLLRMAAIYEKHNMPERANDARAIHATFEELRYEALREEVGTVQPSG